MIHLFCAHTFEILTPFLIYHSLGQEGMLNLCGEKRFLTWSESSAERTLAILISFLGGAQNNLDEPGFKTDLQRIIK